MLTLFGACAVTFMMVMYALERRGIRYVLAFAVGCGLSSAYGFAAGTWPFGTVEAIWSVIAVRRFADARRAAGTGPEQRATTRLASGPVTPPTAIGPPDIAMGDSRKVNQ